MLDHVVLSVRDLESSVAFYKHALAPLGHKSEVTFEGHKGHAKLQGFGDANESYLLLKRGAPGPPRALRCVTLANVCFGRAQISPRPRSDLTKRA